MKILLWASGLTALLLASACQNNNTNNNDSSAAQTGDLKLQLQEEVAVGEAAVQQAEETNNNFNLLGNQLSQAPETLKSDSAYLLINLRLEGLQRKNDAKREEHADLLERLKKLSSDYAAGNIAEEAARLEYTTLRQSFRYTIHDDSMLVQAYGDLSADYGKMMATFKAKAEEN